MNWNQWKKEINEHKWNSKNCLERDLNPRPRLSSADVYIYIYVDIFIIVFYPPYYCNIRYVVLSFDEIKTHYKSLDLNELKADIARAPWHITGALEDIDDS